MQASEGGKARPCAAGIGEKVPIFGPFHSLDCPCAFWAVAAPMKWKCEIREKGDGKFIFMKSDLKVCPLFWPPNLGIESLLQTHLTHFYSYQNVKFWSDWKPTAPPYHKF